MKLIALSYSVAAVVYGLLTVVLILRRESRRRGKAVLAAVAGTAVWGGLLAALFATSTERPRLTAVPDALHTLLWVLCLLTALPGKTFSTGTRGILSLTAIGLAGAAVVLGFVLPERAPLPLLVLSVVGCVVAEQILRNAAPGEKRVLEPFMRTITALLVFDVFVFAEAVLFGGLNAALYAPRGLLAAVAVPFFVLAAKRHPDWEETLYVSREFVFYTATLTGVGLYLIAMAAGVLLLPQQDSEWGGVVLALYFVAAVGVLAFILSSARLKSRVRAFINEHFYRNRFDYRSEWLRLIHTLSAARELPLEQRSIKALASIVGSEGGQLWIDREGHGSWEPFAAWQEPFPTDEIAAGSALAQFLVQHKWVIDTRQYELDPEHYQHAFRTERLPSNSIFVPLMRDDDLFGIVRLTCPPGLRELNYEDHDLLKTAGRQVAAFLAHDLARELLTESRQFEAFNKLSAFLMHDLKNLLAQQVLLVNNAKKYRDRPEFVDDVIKTIDAGAQRMRALLTQLERGAVTSQPQRVELNRVIFRAVSARSNDRVPCSFAGGPTCWVRAKADELYNVLTHLIQNAQEATPGERPVVVKLAALEDGRALIEIRDHGVGMSAEFIRRNLFKPFQSTKGSSGMGIGAYQARELVRALGGDMVVKSDVGRGTTVGIYLPLETSAARQPADAAGAAS